MSRSFNSSKGKSSCLTVSAVLVVAAIPLAGCVNGGGDPATTEFVTRVATESEQRKNNNREAARKREEVRLARKKARKKTTEDLVVGALDFVYGSCFAEPERKTEAEARLETVILFDTKRDYGTGGGGGGGGC